MNQTLKVTCVLDKLTISSHNNKIYSTSNIIKAQINGHNNSFVKSLMEGANQEVWLEHLTINGHNNSIKGFRVGKL